jgi:hypothetical protein
MRVLLATALVLTTVAGVGAFPTVEGWAPAGEASVYGPNNLWEYINGAADNYLAYGFRLLEARNLAAGDVVVTVNVYDMGSPLNAYGVFRSEAPADGTAVAVGAGGVVSPPYQALLAKGRHYVKIDAYKGELDSATASALVRAVAAALPGEDGTPSAFSALPTAGRVDTTLAYTRGGFLGLSELKGCVHATYRDGDREHVVFAMTPDGGGLPTDTMWQLLSATWVGVDHPGLEILTREVPYRGVVGVVRTADGILGVADAGGRDATVARLVELAP